MSPPGVAVALSHQHLWTTKPRWSSSTEGRSAIENGRDHNCNRVHESENCTFSVGVTNAGQWVNCVSSEATAVLSMPKAS